MRRLATLLLIGSLTIPVAATSVDAVAAPRTRACDTAIAFVPPHQVPADVAEFAGPEPVTGEDPLWLVVNTARQVPVFDVDRDEWILPKVVWYRRAAGRIEVELRHARQGSSRTVEISADGYGETGFRPSSLHFPKGGCWRVIARLGDAEVRFRVRVPPGRAAICADIARQQDALRAVVNDENIAVGRGAHVGAPRAGLRLGADPAGEVDVLDLLEHDAHGLAHLDRRRVNLVDRTVRRREQVADHADRRVLVERDDDHVVRRELGVRGQEGRVRDDERPDRGASGHRLPPMGE